MGLRTLDFGSQKIEKRPATLSALPSGEYRSTGDVNDTMSLSALLVGASVGWKGGTTWTWLARLGAGVALRTARDERTGTFQADTSGQREGPTYAVNAETESADARHVYVGSELCAGRALSSKLWITAGVQALVMVALTQPKWNDRNDLVTAPLGLAACGQQSMTGKTLVLLTPSLGLRGEF